MSQDYTVAKELASLKEIKQSAEQRISDLSLNALNYVNDHRLHKSDGGDIDDYYDVIVEWEENDEESYPVITKFPTSDPGHQMRFAVKYTDSEAGTTRYDPLYFKRPDESHVALYATSRLVNGNEAHCDVYKFTQNSQGGMSVEFVRTEIYSDPWPYFDVVVELNGSTGAGVYLKGSYEAMKSAYDSEDATFSMIRVAPKDEENAEPARVVRLYFDEDLTLQDDLSFKYPDGTIYIYYFNPDNTISAVRGGSQ